MDIYPLGSIDMNLIQALIMERLTGDAVYGHMITDGIGAPAMARLMVSRLALT